MIVIRAPWFRTRSRVFSLIAALLLLLSQAQFGLSFSMSSREIYGVKNSGWKSSQWRWGYGVGTGHDCAKICRATYKTESARRKLVDTLIGASDNQVNFEEVKLVLALAWQRGQRDGSDGGAGGYGEVLNAMAQANRYEDDDDALDGSRQLLQDMAQRYSLLQPTNAQHIETMKELVKKSDDIDVARRQCSGMVLCAMGFIQNGC